jgi:isoleucyl-tRNA synthetase
LVTNLGDYVSYSVKPNFKQLGPRFGKDVKGIARALAAVDPEEIVVLIGQHGYYELQGKEGTQRFTSDELDIKTHPKEGFVFQSDGTHGVALDLHITPELRAKGIAREVIRAIQDLRKAKGLAVEDRIRLQLGTTAEVITSALDLHKDDIAMEVLATSVALVGESDASDELLLDEGRVSISIEKA